MISPVSTFTARHQFFALSLSIVWGEKLFKLLFGKSIHGRFPQFDQGLSAHRVSLKINRVFALRQNAQNAILKPMDERESVFHGVILLDKFEGVKDCFKNRVTLFVNSRGSENASKTVSEMDALGFTAFSVNKAKRKDS